MKKKVKKHGSIFEFTFTAALLLTLIFIAGASILETLKHHVPPICSISMLVLFVPQVYWFGIMVKGGLKVIYGKDDSKED